MNKISLKRGAVGDCARRLCSRHSCPICTATTTPLAIVPDDCAQGTLARALSPRVSRSRSGKIGSLDQASKMQLQMGYSVIASKHYDYAGTIFDDLKSKIEKTERDPKIPYVRFICAYLHFLYAEKYLTSNDGTFSKEVPSFAIPAATTAQKRQSTSLSGPSKKARNTKESTPSATIPEVVSQQTTLDAFVGISSTTVAPTSTVPVMTTADTAPVTTQLLSVPQHQSTEVISTALSNSSIPIIPSSSISLVNNPPINM
ncbi:hypothetical protein L6452_36953 [Arctium lappa]|uniref:Uncharacterized protein n=1 Tax=Arctium lappa TaxID=4217 RepID=A0ACB8Y1N5_ARCLA|nr:hypothetical protein L6452_36953 [Arctium lappa]